VLKDLIKIAGELDLLGLNREADIVDALIRKVAGPLADIVEWETGNADLELTDEERIRNKEHRRGVGWGLPPEGVDVTKWVMEKSPGDWVFVIPDNVYNIERYVMSASFEKWLKKKLYGKGHYIFVVGASPYRGDFSDPKWVVHDLVGHSVGNKFTKALVRTGVRYNDWINRQDVGFAIDKIWGLLPPELQNAEEVFDRVFDISTGIMFGIITLEVALGAISSVKTENMENLKKGITLMFESTKGWLEDQQWVTIGGNKVSIIKPWQ
jgi:hypothetical protein